MDYSIFEKLGVTLLNNDGSFRSLKDIMGDLSEAFDRLDETKQDELLEEY